MTKVDGLCRPSYRRMHMRVYLSSLPIRGLPEHQVRQDVPALQVVPGRGGRRYIGMNGMRLAFSYDEFMGLVNFIDRYRLVKARCRNSLLFDGWEQRGVDTTLFISSAAAAAASSSVAREYAFLPETRRKCKPSTLLLEYFIDRTCGYILLCSSVDS